jgi:RNA polymerase primary sigma factor
VWWIRQSILQALAEQSRIVRLPLNKISSINKMNKMLSELEQKYERIPSDIELADMLNINESEIQETLNISRRHVSMEDPISSDDDAGSMYDLLKSDGYSDPDKELLNDSLKKEIERSLSTLTDREAEVIRSFYGLGIKHALSLEEIGDSFGLTRERVRQIKEKAIRTLKNTSRSKLLKAYLG